MSHQAKDIFLLQTELVDTKVTMAAEHAYDKLIKQVKIYFDEVKQDVRELRQEVKHDVQELRNEVKHDVQELRNEVKQDVQNLKTEMNNRFSSLETHVISIDKRLTVVETKVGIANERNIKIKDQFLNYLFKAGWMIFFLVLSASFSLLLPHLH